VFVREVDAKVGLSNVVPWWPYLNSMLLHVGQNILGEIVTKGAN
jgi:hypothetical protein